MKTLPINNKVIGVVEVPEGAYNFEVTADNALIWNGRAGMRWLPPGNWQILGRASQITESQAREIVGKSGGQIFDHDPQRYFSYPDYITVNHPFDNKSYNTALESFQSFCKANQIKETDLILIQPPSDTK